MSIVIALKIKNIRSHSEYSLIPDSKVTIITGLNGSGKTSLLESIYIALRGGSFRGSDMEILRRGCEWWRVDLDLGQAKYTVKFHAQREQKRKEFIIDSKMSHRLPAKSKYPVVLFEPDDLRLVDGSPARRRKFLDTLISQLNPLYGTSLRRYERGLKQRNNLLKQGLKTGFVDEDELFAWDVLLAESGAFVIHQRQKYIEIINTQINSIYKEVSRTNDTVYISYDPGYEDAIQQRLMSELNGARQRDRYIGSTSVGPHRHDMRITLNNFPASGIASRGEVRTILLALKFIEVAITEHVTGKKPIVLLDDVFSELDSIRQGLLSEYLKENQVFITSATSHAGDKFLHVEL